MSACVHVWSLQEKRCISWRWPCKSVKALTAVQMSTHTCHYGLPYFVKVKCIQAGGSVTLPPIHSSGLSNITATVTTTTVKQQIYIQPHRSMLLSENVISYSRLGWHSRQCTDIICGFWLNACVDSTLCPPLLVRLSFFTRLSPLALASSPFLLGLLHSAPLLSHPFPPLTSFSSLLFPACQDDFRLVASGLT